ncbi:MAG: KEOPS complex subunit Cgi121 [Halobacteriaceae archaeon]
MRLIEGIAAVDTDEPPAGATEFPTLDAFINRLQTIGDAHGCAVQAFDPEVVAGSAHLESAVEHANRSMARGENVATDRAVEILCYAAGTRQIDVAVQRLGISPGAGPVVLVVDGGALGVPRDEAPIGDPAGDEAGAAAAVDALLADGHALERADTAEIEATFGIGPAERAATTAGLEALVRERVALLDVEK